MRSSSHCIVLTTAVWCVASAISHSTAAENWPQWRGPNADGSSATADPPTTWSETENVQWKVEVPGKGSGTPIVWENRIYLLTAIPTVRPAAEAAATDAAADDRAAPTTLHQFALLAFDLRTGEKLWQSVAAEAVPNEPGHATNSFASSSPVTDGRHLYASFGSHGIYCFNMQGKQVWQRDLGKMQTRNQFGEGSSPALLGDTLVVPWDHEGQSQMIALDAANGQTRWAVDRDERTTWATPLIVQHAGGTQVVTNGHTVRSYDLQTGELLWQCGGQVENPIPTPVRLGDLVICMTGYRGNAIYAIPLDARGDVSDSDTIAWSRQDAAPYVASPALYKGQLYFTKSRDGIVSSLDAKTGEVVIPQSRLPGISSVYASPVAAADRIYLTGRDGATTVIRHGSELEVLATNKLDEGIDASPVMIGDVLLLRGEQHLYCIHQAK